MVSELYRMRREMVGRRRTELEQLLGAQPTHLLLGLYKWHARGCGGWAGMRLIVMPGGGAVQFAVVAVVVILVVVPRRSR